MGAPDSLEGKYLPCPECGLANRVPKSISPPPAKTYSVPNRGGWLMTLGTITLILGFFIGVLIAADYESADGFIFAFFTGFLFISLGLIIKILGEISFYLKKISSIEQSKPK